MTLLLDITDNFTALAGYVVCFLVGVFITRWVFGIDKIIDALKTQNEQSLIQSRLLKKMLLNQGVSVSEIDDIIINGNKKSEV